MEAKFNFEQLEVWQRSIDFCTDVVTLSEVIISTRKHYRLVEQIESSAASIAANIAEGKGRYSKKEFIQFLYIAKGSLFETITFLTIFYRMRWISQSDLENAKVKGEELGKMISSLITSIRSSII